MLDRERILARIDVLDGYLRELHTIAPATFEEYTFIEKRRACERLPQVSIECVIDISSLLVIGLRLSLPAEEDDLFEKLTAGRDYFPLYERNFEENERIAEHSGARIWGSR